MGDRRFLLALAAVVAAAAALRVPGLDRRGLWLDELFTARVIGRESWAGLLDEVARDVHPPGYFAALRLWAVVAGNGDAALRWPSVLAGLASVAIAGLLARRLAGDRAGIAAALLLACAPFSTWLDREVRSNALLALLSVAGLALLGVPTARRWLAYAGVAAALPWVHAFGPIVLLAHGLWIAAEAAEGERPAADLGRWLACGLGAALAFVPWMGTLLAQHREFSAEPWYTRPPADAFAWIHRSLSGDSATVSLGLAVGVGLAIAGPAGTRVGALVLSHAVAIVGVPAACSLLGSPVLRDRNAIALVPVLAIGAGAGFALLRPAIATLALLVVAGTGALVSWRGTLDGEGESWREIAALVADKADPADQVYATHPNLWPHYLTAAIRRLEAPGADAQSWLARHPGGRTWLLEAHDLDDARWDAFVASGLVLRSAVLPGARALLVDRGAIAVSIGTELPPPLRDAGGLHLYWSVSTRSAPLRVDGTCRIGVVGHGDNAGGIPAELALRFIRESGEGTGTVESRVGLPDAEQEVLGEASEIHGTASVELEFLNDSTGAEGGGDRNAHVRQVFLRCAPTAPADVAVETPAETAAAGSMALPTDAP